MKVHEVIKILKEDGWAFCRQTGSHRQYIHPEKSGKVTVPGNLADDLPVGTLKSILRQAGIKDKES
jgi:predicted RNA binding protein YcfA (HicA-like mRNA interferase family)